jgi:hypothetical protein
MPEVLCNYRADTPDALAPDKQVWYGRLIR